MAQGRTD